MPKHVSIKINYIFNIILSYLDVLFPIITAPYVSRVLGASNLGKVNLATTLINAFIVVAAFGTAAYGVREIAKVKDNREKLDAVFSELMLIRAITTAITVVMYLIVIHSFDAFIGESLYFILLPNLIISIIQIDWFYQGISDFKYITIRAGIMKVICLILMFATIRTENDYTMYGFIILFGMVGSCILNYVYSRKFVTLRFTRINIFRHRALYIFFITSVIYTVYLMFDQIVLGIMQDSAYVAFLNRSKTIVLMITAIITSLITVLIPKASMYYSVDKELVNRLFKKAINFIYVVSIPITVGAIFLSYEIMYILGGYEFSRYYWVTAALAFTIPFVSVKSLLKNQFIIPSGNEGFVAKSEAVCIVIYILINLIFIPIYGIWACIAAIFVYEILTFVSTFVYCKKNESFLLLSKSLFNATVASILVGISTHTIKLFDVHYVVILILSAIIGGVIYAVTLIILKDSVVDEIINFTRK